MLQIAKKVLQNEISGYIQYAEKTQKKHIFGIKNREKKREFFGKIPKRCFTKTSGYVIIETKMRKGKARGVIYPSVSDARINDADKYCRGVFHETDFLRTLGGRTPQVKRTHAKIRFECVATNDVLSMDNAALCKGSAGVSVLGKCAVDEELLRTLHGYGIRYLSTRSIGYNHIDLKAG